MRNLRINEERQRHRERGAFVAPLARGRNSSAMLLHEPAHECESYAEPLGGPLAASSWPREHVEDVRQVAALDSGAIVAHLDRSRRSIAAHREPGVAAPRGELGRVCQ